MKDYLSVEEPNEYIRHDWHAEPLDQLPFLQPSPKDCTFKTVLKAMDWICGPVQAT